MTNIFNRFKIPTLLGLGLIIIGIISGLYLVLREQIFLSQAAPNLAPQNVTITNITDNSVVISWQTNAATYSFITYGQQNPGEQTALDDRDNNQLANSREPRLIHYMTLKNLLPNTNYLFKITSGKLTSETMKFTTAIPITNQSGFTPVIGSVIDGNNPLNDGVAYLFIQDAIIESSLIKTGGNFLIPVSQIRKTDLSGLFPMTEETIAKLIIRSDKGDASIKFKLQANSSPLPLIKLGQNIDLTILTETSSPSPAIKDLDKYDLNNDGKINAADYAILFTCINIKSAATLPENISCVKTDINTDGVINKKDTDLMSQKLKDLGSQ